MAALVPDVIYLAVTSNSLPESLHSLGLRVTAVLTETLNQLASFNEEVDFQTTPQIKDYLGARRVAPERKMRDREKEALANKLGFHLLSLPGWWRPACVQSPTERLNSLLQRQLRQLWRLYWELETALSHAPVPSSPKTSLKCP